MSTNLFVEHIKVDIVMFLIVYFQHIEQAYTSSVLLQQSCTQVLLCI
jgi:hypothetical protein